MTDNFYTAFEHRYRGSRELIMSRLRVYLPFVESLREFYGSGDTIDLGCGRGEWLELLQNSGFTSQGVDLDEGMLASCRDLGLNVRTHDAIEFIKELPDCSQAVVSGFHLAEHLPFSSLQILIQEALRVLKPGGILILETPNPENITVGTEKFYLDPTHLRPIPSQFLSFMVEHAGFKRSKVLRLQEPTGLANESSLILLSVLNGVSPDYAVLAQKAGTHEIEAATAAAFEIEYGLSLETLANNYDRQLKTFIQQVDAVARQADARSQQADARSQQADARSQQADARSQQADA
ncbi:MAG: class I SAM-dependent methyltransferase, partial [Gallionellaceae bacterium]|nr:class I SAM-dependent methyltransferase [Gallionellaceae bacterium]